MQRGERGRTKLLTSASMRRGASPGRSHGAGSVHVGNNLGVCHTLACVWYGGLAAVVLRPRFQSLWRRWLRISRFKAACRRSVGMGGCGMSPRPSADFRTRRVAAIDAGLPRGEAAQLFRRQPADD